MHFGERESLGGEMKKKKKKKKKLTSFSLLSTFNDPGDFFLEKKKLVSS